MRISWLDKQQNGSEFSWGWQGKTRQDKTRRQLGIWPRVLVVQQGIMQPYAYAMVVGTLIGRYCEFKIKLSKARQDLRGASRVETEAKSEFLFSLSFLQFSYFSHYFLHYSLSKGFPNCANSKGGRLRERGKGLKGFGPQLSWFELTSLSWAPA